ncbi:MAG: hypothetical protein V2A73_02870 [Pseudomonadota bacterium]
MSLKRSHAEKLGGSRRSSGDDLSGAKVDRQELWDELQKRCAAGDTFVPQDIARAIGGAEPAIAKCLLNLASERLLDKAEGGGYRATSLGAASQAEFVRALAARSDPKRQQDQVEIDRLKKNNDEMRRRLLEAVADRDRCLALLKKHGIDPTETP